MANNKQQVAMAACLDAWGKEMAAAVDGGHVLDGDVARCVVRQSLEIDGKMRDVVVTFELADQQPDKQE